MPVTTPASYAEDLRDSDHFTHVLTHLFTPALKQADYTVIPPKMLGATLIHAEIIRHLEQADLVLADLSDHNANVFFELGIRTSLDRPVVLVKDKRTTQVAFDVGPINILTYDESLATWTLDNEISNLADHIRKVPAASDSGNDMWRYFGLTKRGDPAEAGSLEAKVDLLLTEVTKLRLAPATLAPAAAAREPDQPRLNELAARITTLLMEEGFPPPATDGAVYRLPSGTVHVVITGPSPADADFPRRIAKLANELGVAVDIVRTDRTD